MCQLICLSYQDQELLMLDQRYQQYAKIFDHINKFQVQGGMIPKGDGHKDCKLFQFFVLKAPVLKLICRKQPLQEKPAANVPSATNEQGVAAMEVVSEYQLLKYSYRKVDE